MEVSGQGSGVLLAEVVSCSESLGRTRVGRVAEVARLVERSHHDEHLSSLVSFMVTDNRTETDHAPSVSSFFPSVLLKVDFRSSNSLVIFLKKDMMEGAVDGSLLSEANDGEEDSKRFLDGAVEKEQKKRMRERKGK